MYAAWYEELGAAEQVLQYGEMETPSLGPDDVLVRVHTSGVNPSDVKARSGGGRRPKIFPRIIPNSDGAGVIEAVGSAVASSRVGERVWLWNAQFGRPFGTAAEYVVLPSYQAVHLPDNVDFAAGACLGIPALTAYHTLFADGPISGQTVLITGGAGAVGHAAVQLAKWGGATVITTVSSPEKEAIARDAGADYVLNYKKEDVAARINEISGGKGIDRVVDVSFGQNAALDVSVLKINGVIAAFDSVTEAYPPLPFFEMLLKNITLHVVLVYIISEAARERSIAGVNAALAEGALRPIVAAHFPLRETAQAHKAVESGNVIGNVVIDVA